MSSWHRVLTCLAVLCAIAWLGPASAVAGTSAGDQQYIDPLAGSGLPANAGQSGHSSTRTPTSPAPTTTTAAPTVAAPTATPASSSTPRAAATTHADPPGKTLPMTGLDVWLAAAIGLGLLVAGMAMRRASSASL